MLKKILILTTILLLSLSVHIYSSELEDIDISSPNAILMEQNTKRVLYFKNEREKVKIASTTKILTAIVAVENCELDEIVTISKNAALTGGSTVGLKSGSKVSLKALMYGMLLKSGNDCAVAIAEHVGGNITNFVKMMNDKAYELGAKDTFCTNPHGLDSEENYSTAYDLALIMCYAKQNEVISKIMGTENVTLPFDNSSKYLSNTNRLLFTYEYCDGGKTGYTSLANRCLVLSGKKDDLNVVAVVLGAETTDKRFSDGKKLLKYAIDNYKMEDVSNLLTWYIDIPILKGNSLSYTDKITFNVKLPLKENEKNKLYISENILPVINAPFNKENYIGNIEVCINNEVLYKENIYLKKEIQKNNVIDYMILGLKNVFNIC